MASMRQMVKLLVLGWAFGGVLGVSANAVELKAKTAAAFDRYIRATEDRMVDELRDGSFLVIDGFPDTAQQRAYIQLRQGQIYIKQLHMKEDGKSIPIPDGLIHHWVGVAFIPGATLPQTLAILQDYDNHRTIYKPDIRQSKLLERNGDDFKVYLQISQRSVLLNLNLDVQYALLNSTHAMSQLCSTRVAEVESEGGPDEHELPMGKGHGYIWRLCMYWRIEEKDGGVYVQVESVGLSRTIPWAIAWLVNPMIRGIPKSVLSHFLNQTRIAVTDSAGSGHDF